ncbi:hypothetical protein F1C16_08945 [Hymenobacter sp. NBH84]|uniref:enhanced serine sensitivity protein SseB C-terminal domain-containing protein n=1 Tax=Hymenobacter sp. NBH84 TaxID=2596915 RepID=UPI0016274F1E|nr:enhanced serine sensitivity protein SseB C-terminal domain-containing protein [Hymenobacter sp. NBH84]QNE39670.1 hypothetical protein F1C16_08945 [Hymenobacter sp. NBH84]
MGLFDFLKPKNEPTSTPTPSATPTPSTPEQPATPGGPRYKGSNYTSPPQAGVPAPPPMPPMPPMQEPYIPPMPPMPDFEPTNVLEELLMRAAAEPSARPIFYRALLQEEVVVVLHPKEGLEPGEVTPTEGMEIQLQVLNDGKIPVFTSLERVSDGAVEQETISYLRLRGIDLFQMVQGADCALNPFSPVGKLLPAAELADLLAGNLTNIPGEGEGQEMQVMLGPPHESTAGLAEAVRTYCATNPDIEAAYLAQMQIQGSPEPPRLLLAFHSTAANPDFLQEFGPTLQEHLTNQPQLDMMLIDPASGEPINQYFLQSEPIYQK